MCAAASDWITSGDSDIASRCTSAGNGVIAAATFAMLFGVLSVVFLHYYTSFQGRCCKLPFPRIFNTIASFLALCLYIVVVATWYEKCHNPLSNTIFCYGTSCPNGGQEVSPTAGYCVATAIVCVVMAFIAWLFSFWRICFPNKDEPTPEAAGTYNTQASTSDLRVSSPSAASSTPYKAPEPAPASSSRGGAYSNGNTYGNDDEDSNAGGGGGGYGGSAGGYGGGGGAYSNSSYGGSYGGSSGKQQSAYGY